MTVFSIAIEITAPSERVWQVMSDVERWHEWTASIKSVRRLGSGAFAVGSRVLIRQPKLPPAFWKVVAIEPGKSFTWISASPGVSGDRLSRRSVHPKGKSRDAVD
jgi:uncharacterized membrane protein